MSIDPNFQPAEANPYFKIQSPQDDCPVCYEPLNRDGIIAALKCNDVFHLFHNTCISKGLQIDKRCPVCRSDNPSISKIHLPVENEDAVGLVRFVQVLQERVPQIAWPVIQKNNPLIDAERIREWMKENQDVLNQITQVNLDDCDLSILPPEINYFSELTVLSLRGNFITSLPEGFNPKKLRILELADLPITSLPKGFNPKGLRGLNIFNTLITSLPEGFDPPHLVWTSTLIKLRNAPFKLDDLSIASLPESFNLPNLQRLELGDTPIIASLPESFNLPNLL